MAYLRMGRLRNGNDCRVCCRPPGEESGGKGSQSGNNGSQHKPPIDAEIPGVPLLLPCLLSFVALIIPDLLFFQKVHVDSSLGDRAGIHLVERWQSWSF